MIFSSTSAKLLGKMRIDAEAYSCALEAEFCDDAQIFNLIIENFNKKNKIKGNKEFVSFFTNSGYDDFDSKLTNYAYELYNNLGRFFTGGVLELYRCKQVEWGAPEVKISTNDVPSSDIHLLNQKQVIYRGLLRQEYATKKFGQSWTLDQAIAYRFAKQTYSDKPGGIVVRATINKEDVIYYDKNNIEKEVIVKADCILDASEIET